GEERGADACSQRRDTGARQRRDVDDGSRGVAARVDQGVCQHHATLCVCRMDLDADTVTGHDDVGGTVRGAVGHVLDTGADGNEVHGHSQLGDGLHRTEHRGCSSHVALHGDHAVFRLEGKAAGVERHALAYQHQGGEVEAPCVVFEDYEGRFVAAALGDCQESAHLVFGCPDLVADVQRQAVALCQVPGMSGEVGGVGDVGWLVDQVSCRPHGPGDDGSATGPCLDLVQGGTVVRHQHQGVDAALLPCPAERGLEPVGGKHAALDGRLRHVGC